MRNAHNSGAFWHDPGQRCLLLRLSELGDGIELAAWGAMPVTVVELDGSMKRFSEPVFAGIAAPGAVAGALSVCGVSRGGCDYRDCSATDHSQ